VSREYILENRILPVQIKEDQLILAMSDPSDDDAVLALEEKTGKPVGLRYVCLNDDIVQTVKHFEDQAAILQREREEKEQEEKRAQENGREKPEEMITMSETDRTLLEQFTLGDDEMSEVFVGVRPIVDAIIRQGLLLGASDIHIERTKKETIVRFRIDGILVNDAKIDSILDKAGRNRKLHENLVNIIKNRSGEAGKTMRLDETEKPQDGRIYIPEVDLDLRVSVIPTILGESVVIRIHYREIGKYTLDKLGFDAGMYEKFHGIISNPYGLILIAGPTGSGKTTTLYAILQIINSPTKKTLTVEDPVEYSIPGTNQAQINPAKDFDFNQALRAFLRHDPDIIMVGEIRDMETASMAMEAALTGHLVLSSIHANDAITTVHRLRDLGVDPRLVTATCLGTLGQRLVRRVCSHCKRPQIFSTKLYHSFEQYGIQYNPRKLVKGAGCPKCNQTGYHGRVGIFELLPMSYDIKEMFLKDCTVEEISDVARKQGMKNLLEDALFKVAKGITTEEEVWRVTLLEGAR
jgi:type II secretory ATPase GspE/PulE/Tfp pilus assembly ATPase PilB-like protein